MSGLGTDDSRAFDPVQDVCEEARSNFSDYLDGALDGRTMGALAAHVESCRACGDEFEAWRAMQDVLVDLGPAQPPVALQAQLRDALASERDRGTYLSPLQQVSKFWHRTLAPMCLRVSGGLAGAMVLIGSLIWFIGTAVPVQANDDRLADLHPPRFLYSQEPPQPISTTGQYVAVLVDAKVNADGRVYDYSILDGPQDPQTRARVEANLLSSYFKPATVFGVPVPGHAMMTYTTVDVRG